MTRTEFLQELQDSLRGEVNPSIIQETVNYYTRYIDEAVAGGQSEQAVLESLGPARLIAKSIIEANSVKRNAETAGQTQQAQEEVPKKRSGFTFRSWYGRLLLILLAFVAVGIILALIVGTAVVVWKLLPVLAVIILIIVLVRVFLRIGKD